MAGTTSRLKRFLLTAVLLIVVAVIALYFWLDYKIPRVFADCAAQETAAELVMVYHGRTHQLPARWEDLRDCLSDSQLPHRDPNQGLAYFQEIIIMDFSLLPELQRLGASSTRPDKLPEAIRTVSGGHAHFEGAAPNGLLYEYFRQGKFVYSDHP